MKKNIRFLSVKDTDRERVYAWLKGLDPVLLRLIIMRINLVILAICFSIFNVCASGHAQGISLNYEKGKLKDVLEQIAKQSGYPAMYNNSHLSKAKAVSLKLKNATLEQALTQCFKDQPLNYEIIDKTIVVTLKPISIRERIISFIKAIKITGTVKDENNQPIAGVTVKPTTGSGLAITDQNGIFSIEVPDDKTILQFSYIGYATQEQ